MATFTVIRRSLPACALLIALTATGCVYSHAAATATQPSAAPVYPGSKVESADMSAMTGPGAPSGKAFSTTDSFDTVYTWYKKNLPEGSEQAHVTAPTEAATFYIGQGTHRMSVALAVSPLCCRTIIVITAFPNG